MGMRKHEAQLYRRCGVGAYTEPCRASQLGRDPTLAVWAAVRRRAGSAPCAHALGAAGAAVGARRVLLALADARVLDWAQGGDLRKQRGRRPSAQAAMASVQGVARAYPACRWKGTAAAPDDCSSSCIAANSPTGPALPWRVPLCSLQLQLGSRPELQPHARTGAVWTLGLEADSPETKDHPLLLCTAQRAETIARDEGAEGVASPRAGADRSRHHRRSGQCPSCRCSEGRACLRGSSPSAPCSTRCGTTCVACRCSGRPCRRKGKQQRVSSHKTTQSGHGRMDPSYQSEE